MYGEDTGLIEAGGSPVIVGKFGEPLVLPRLGDTNVDAVVKLELLGGTCGGGG